jgi:hypothetical protein
MLAETGIRRQAQGTSNSLFYFKESGSRGKSSVVLCFLLQDIRDNRGTHMRKLHQKQISELAGTLAEAHAEIKRMLAAGQSEAAIGLLSECQEVAARIGDFIEQLAGEGTKTVAHLEEYRELLRRAAAEIGGPGGGGDGRHNSALVKPLQKQLAKTEHSVRTDLKPDGIEMVFLPYKASMWDSFETVWLAAKGDPACDAYVVPIPYCELNPDGSFGKMHCDDKEYPDYVPIVDWREYDIEARRPDVIFIHYQYDDSAGNASILPDFYGKRLRAHCDLLVYIPYFVIVGDAVADYCGRLPGEVYAHRVILQSEAVRRAYIGNYKKADRQYGWKGRFGKAEEKFVALGSPKFDRVINTRREDLEIPDEWRKLIEKPDGTRKKVILYNTHMFAWLNGGEAYFKKLRCVFDLFRERDDVVLWWRPHPNTELNFRVMRPQLLGEYVRVVSDYRR